MTVDRKEAAMANEMDALIKLAAIDDEIHNKEVEITEKPRKLDEEKKYLADLEKEISLIAEDIQKVQKDAHLAEVEVKGIEKEITDFAVKLNTVKGNEEYRLITEKIGDLKEKKSDMEERAIEFLTQVDSYREQSKELEAKVTKEKERLAGVEQEVNQLVERLNGEIAELKEARAKQAAEISPEVLDKYNRALKRLGSNIVVKIQGDCCSGCYMSVKPNDINMVMGGKIVFCKHCNRILYIDENE